MPTERKAVIKLFESLDDQQNGFVPVAKIDGYLKSAHLPIGKMDRKRIVQLCDTNGDGYVQKLDLVNALSKLDSMVSVNMCMPSKVARANHMVASMMVDTNSVIAAKRVGTEPRSPRDILQGWFAPKQRPQNVLEAPADKGQPRSRNPTIPNKRILPSTAPPQRAGHHGRAGAEACLHLTLVKGQEFFSEGSPGEGYAREIPSGCTSPSSISTN